MSRIGKVPIPIPEGITVTIDGNIVTVKGAKGQLSQTMHNDVSVAQADGMLQVSIRDENNHRHRALWGLSRVLINNMIEGLTKGYSKQLELQGVGYRMQMQGKNIVLQLGFSHPVEFALPEGVEGKIEGNIVTLSSVNKHLLGETAAQLRALKKPEPYKGKGIRYVGEQVRRKAGKVVKGSE